MLRGNTAEKKNCQGKDGTGTGDTKTVGWVFIERVMAGVSFIGDGGYEWDPYNPHPRHASQKEKEDDNVTPLW